MNRIFVIFVKPCLKSLDETPEAVVTSSWQQRHLGVSAVADSPKQEHERLYEGMEVVVAVHFWVRIKLDISKNLCVGCQGEGWRQTATQGRTG